MEKRQRYPGVAEAEKERVRSSKRRREENEEPDFIGGAPNYEKFKGMTPEEVLVYLNMD